VGVGNQLARRVGPRVRVRDPGKPRTAERTADNMTEPENFDDELFADLYVLCEIFRVISSSDCC
jgi:hypothetical protein